MHQKFFLYFQTVPDWFKLIKSKLGDFFLPGEKSPKKSRVTNQSYVMPNFDGNSISLSSRLEKKMAQLKYNQAVYHKITKKTKAFLPNLINFQKKNRIGSEALDRICSYKKWIGSGSDRSSFKKIGSDKSPFEKIGSDWDRIHQSDPPI